MHFGVFADGRNMGFRHSGIGDVWTETIFVRASVEEAVSCRNLAAQALDCLGRRVVNATGQTWQISRDDLMASDVIVICEEIQRSPNRATTWSLTRQVVVAICRFVYPQADTAMRQRLANEVNRMFLCNSMAYGGK